jgi:translation initiation factor eIF-2B subunit delta
VTPEGLSLQRHLTTYLGKQIDFITTTRPLAASMKSAIRWVKNEIATMEPDMPDADVSFIRILFN